jgi:uncharacterized membrane protein YfcA
VIYLLLLGCGMVSGFLAGFVGTGGGLGLAPTLLFVLPLLRMDAALVPTMAAATSLAIVVPAAASAVLAQYRASAQRFDWLRLLATGGALGSAIGSKFAGSPNAVWITLVLAVYATFVVSKLVRQTSSAHLAC